MFIKAAKNDVLSATRDDQKRLIVWYLIISLCDDNALPQLETG
jgi:hypothetical protein